jgi:hypothetical protein
MKDEERIQDAVMVRTRGAEVLRPYMSCDEI